MRIENEKIYVDDYVIAVIDKCREVVRVLKKCFLKDVIDFAISDKILKDYSWETYSHEE